MNFLIKLERKFGGRGIRNLTGIIIMCYIIGYVLQMITPELLDFLSLEPILILHGQIWRLVTWVLIPPGTFNIFTIITLFFYYSIGTSMEQTWGGFMYTLYILSGIVFTIIGAFLLFFITGSHYYMGNVFSTYYISMSIFLSYAATFPNMRVYLYGIFPIKVKWLGMLYGAMLFYPILNYVRRGAWYMAVPILASLLNFVIYFFCTQDLSRYNPKEIKRKKEFRKAIQPTTRVQPGSGVVTKHKCAVCGQTEKDDPNLEFRFCSRCNGNYEYCQNHLFTHEHIK